MVRGTGSRASQRRQRVEREASTRRLRLLDEQLAASTAADPTASAAPGEAVGGQEVHLVTARPGEAEQPARRPDHDEAAFAARGRHAARSLPWHQRSAGALLDRAPRGTYPLGTAHVAVLGLVGLIAVVTALWWLDGARPRPAPVADAPVIGVPTGSPPLQAVPTGQPSSALTTGLPSSPTGLGSSPPPAGEVVGEVVVDVAGKVRRPGIVTLPLGSRVADALAAAGGVRPGVDTAALNLARPLVDGEQVLVGLPALTGPATGPAPASTPTAGTAPLVDLNTATMEQLDLLPGIGPVTAQSILDWRAEHGAFSTVDELLEVDGIGDVTLADLRDLVTV